MISVKKIVPSNDDFSSSGITLGGGEARVGAWPKNPQGEPLLLVATFECSKFNQAVNLNIMPDDSLLYVFSTYSNSDYFLDSVTYGGDPAELKGILSGYTKVMVADAKAHQSSPIESIPKLSTEFQDDTVSEDEFIVSSMFSATFPKALVLPGEIRKDYDFVCQLYSSDFPDPFKDIFYLTDAVGYLLLKKSGAGEGLFFVQTA